MLKYIFLFISVHFSQLFFAQQDMVQLKEVVIRSSRIDLPFSKNSKTIQIISAEAIQKSTALNVADLLQHEAGIDVRRRGVGGMQSDLYIRGGSFEQTLILIDGIKTNDPQTGHHTMNMMIPLENIERIEIVKGPSARIFGQNAFTGAINIVTKKQVKDKVLIDLRAGSFDRKSVSVSASRKFKSSSHQVHYSNNSSAGYRDNTDFNNQNYFLKSLFNTEKQPIQVLASFAERKFGANNFYTNSPSFNEYEETQTSLIGVSTAFISGSFIIKPKVYWKRNQDVFLLKRDKPSFSRNFNVSNKLGAEVNASYTSKLGVTGFGVDLAKTILSSNNLGDQNRTMFSAFLEQRFTLGKFDFTPGVSAHYFSDFKFNAFPGFDIGYTINPKIKVYGNIGYSYRIPTYTELYISIPNFLSGNAFLEPEKALAQELGLKYFKGGFRLETAFFRREAIDLIDYIKETSASPFFLAQNLRKVTTKGFEVNSSCIFKINDFKQSLTMSYTFLEDDYDAVDVYASRYLINTSMKHQFVTTLQTNFLSFLEQSISYRYVERPSNSYSIVDAKVTATWSSFKVYALANNMFNTVYSEKNFVPMPKGNLLFGLSYVFD